MLNKFAIKPSNDFRKESMRGQVKAKSDLQDFSGIEEGSSVRIDIYQEECKSGEGFENVS